MSVFDNTLEIRFRTADTAAFRLGSTSTRAACFRAGFDSNHDGRNG